MLQNSLKEPVVIGVSAKEVCKGVQGWFLKCPGWVQEISRL
jgi:hypothetical protein